MRTQEAIDWAGGTQQKLADKLGCSQQVVCGWKICPPASRQLQIEVLSRGKLKADPLARKMKALKNVESAAA